MPLENLGLLMKRVILIEIIAVVGPDVRDRPGHEDSSPLPLQEKFAGRGQTAGARRLAFPILHVQIERTGDMMKLQTTSQDRRNR